MEIAEFQALIENVDEEHADIVIGELELSSVFKLKDVNVHMRYSSIEVKYTIFNKSYFMTYQNIQLTNSGIARIRALREDKNHQVKCGFYIGEEGNIMPDPSIYALSFLNSVHKRVLSAVVDVLYGVV